MSGPGPDDETPVGVDAGAPVVATDQIEIAASPEAVWDVLTGFEEWPSWNRDVKSLKIDGDVSPGTVFRWKAGPSTITSTIDHVLPPRLISWTGKTVGIKAIHFWHLEPRDGATLVRSEESYQGFMARLFRGRLKKTLEAALAEGLGDLKREVERRAAQ